MESVIYHNQIIRIHKIKEISINLNGDISEDIEKSYPKRASGLPGPSCE